MKNTKAAAEEAVALDRVCRRAVADDRARHRAIMALPEVKGRERLANRLSFETDDPVEKVQKALAAAPKEESRLVANMRKLIGLSSSNGAQGQGPRGA